MLHSIKDLCNNAATHALLWALIHSLWQGIVFAVIAAIVLYQTKKSSVQLRYKLLCTLLTTFVITFICTIFYELNTLFQPIESTATINHVSIISYENYYTNNLSLKDKLFDVFQSSQYLIVLFYLLMIAIKCINIIIGFRTVYRLKHQQTCNAEAYWNERLNQLAAKISLTKHVRLLQSTLVKIPVVVGYFKPVILFPASAITSLSIIEIEAILLHELAHIKRNDYIINIIQNFVEIIFFFNPAVLWISSLIKEERENCCDDVAIHHSQNKKQFLQALVSFQEHYLTTNYAPSFAGKKAQLLRRVKRVITNNNKTLNNMEKIFLASGIIITSLVAATVPQNLNAHILKNIPSKSSKNYTLKTIDTIPFMQPDTNDSINQKNITDAQEQIIKLNDDSLQQQMKIMQDKADEVAKQAQIISKADAVKIQKQVMQAQSKAMKIQSKQMQVEAEKLAKQAEALSKIDETKMQALTKQAQAAALLAQVDIEKQLKNVEQLKELKDLDQVKLNEELNEFQQNYQLRLQLQNQQKMKEVLMKELHPEIDKDVQQQINDLRKENKALKDSLYQLKIKPSSLMKHATSDIVVR